MQTVCLLNIPVLQTLVISKINNFFSVLISDKSNTFSVVCCHDILLKIPSRSVPQISPLFNGV